jgi:hypothetical protein
MRWTKEMEVKSKGNITSHKDRAECDASPWVFAYAYQRESLQCSTTEVTQAFVLAGSGS